MTSELDWNRAERSVNLRKGAHMKRATEELRTCVACGRSFHPWLNGSPNQFCSRTCANPHNLAKRTPATMGYLLARDATR